MSKPEAVKKETSVVTLKDVIFMYSSVSRPVEQLNTDKKSPLSDDPLEFHSYEIKVLVVESRYKKLKKAYTGAKNLTNAKEYTAEEAEEKFDLDLIDRLGVDKDDDLIMIKFSQTCLVGKAGNRRPSLPITQIGIKGKVQDHNGVTIDHETQIGNGTEGHFQFRPVDGANGLYLYPHLVCITNLVEYVGTVEEDLESLGLEELSDEELAEMEETPVDSGEPPVDPVDSGEPPVDPVDSGEPPVDPVDSGDDEELF